MDDIYRDSQRVTPKMVPDPFDTNALVTRYEFNLHIHEEEKRIVRMENSLDIVKKGTEDQRVLVSKLGANVENINTNLTKLIATVELLPKSINDTIDKKLDDTKKEINREVDYVKIKINKTKEEMEELDGKLGEYGNFIGSKEQKEKFLAILFPSATAVILALIPIIKEFIL